MFETLNFNVFVFIFTKFKIYLISFVIERSLFVVHLILLNDYKHVEKKANEAEKISRRFLSILIKSY